MKKLIATGLIAGSLCLGVPASAHEPNVYDNYDDGVMHPLRLAYYVIHPIGFTAEWLIGRPFQYVISRDGLSNIFGWRAVQDEAAYRGGIGANDM
jgi:hypothetical protein